MVCKNCSAWNDDRANFCAKCGGELYKSTLVTSPVSKSVTATAVPTTGIRAFSGIGNAFLKSADLEAPSALTGVPRSDTYHSYYNTFTTGAKARLRKDGMWICPDCGELNGHEKLYCTGCGRYR